MLRLPSSELSSVLLCGVGGGAVGADGRNVQPTMNCAGVMGWEAGVSGHHGRLQPQTRKLPPCANINTVLLLMMFLSLGSRSWGGGGGGKHKAQLQTAEVLEQQKDGKNPLACHQA